MKTSAWPVIVLMTLTSYLFLSIFSGQRIFVLLFFPLLFGYIVSRDEWRTGRVVLLSIIPIFISTVMVFVISFILAAFVNSPVLRSELVSRAAVAFLALLFLSGLLGVPLAWVGTRIRAKFSHAN